VTPRSHNDWLIVATMGWVVIVPVWVMGWLGLCWFGLWACVDLSCGWVCADLGVEYAGWVHSQVNGLLMDLVRCVINMIVW